jgi:hypothetical protein
MRWLWTYRTLETHVVFLLAIGLLSAAFRAGNPGPANDHGHALLFCVLADRSGFDLVAAKTQSRE